MLFLDQWEDIIVRPNETTVIFTQWDDSYFHPQGGFDFFVDSMPVKGNEVDPNLNPIPNPNPNLNPIPNPNSNHNPNREP